MSKLKPATPEVPPSPAPAQEGEPKATGPDLMETEQPWKQSILKKVSVNMDFGGEKEVTDDCIVMVIPERKDQVGAQDPYRQREDEARGNFGFLIYYRLQLWTCSMANEPHDIVL
ncbi:hypothetical protein L2E82_47350 [Cichorium intybus]|uniref:Uncharacterized protein n=1 Tax=Cichorium intybus TaxID=13427 RepID=A0ACB8YWR8_CICIN|nr:hypothetical protein L2E82_47350 [Cichorium intybus]